MSKLDTVVRFFAKIFGIEKLYEKILEDEIKDGPLPKHIGIIMDGNRRWSKRKGISFRLGYKYGADKAEEIINLCAKYNIKIVTLYTLSRDNISKRPKDQLDAIYDAIREKIKYLKESKIIEKNKIRINIIGNIDSLPEDIKKELNELEEKTKNNDRLIVNIAIGYSGREEILYAVKKIAKEYKDGKIDLDKLDIKEFSKYLYTGEKNIVDDPDLIIRTAGEYRLSDFLLFQSAYSELIFLDLPWPEIRKIDFLRALRTYKFRKRNFGA